MSSKKFFYWLGSDSYPRRGAMLTRGEKYRAEDYGEAIVDAWIATGHATHDKPKQQGEK